MRSCLRTLALMVAGAAALAAAGGCRTYVAITAWEMGSLNIGAGKHIVLVATEGRPSAREEVLISASQQLRAGGYFSVEDQSESGASVRVSGRSVQVSGGPALAPDHLGMWFKVHDWDAERQARQERRNWTETVNNQLVERTEIIETVVVAGTAVIEFAVWAADGRAIAAGREYEGRVTLDERASEDDARKAAGADAIAQFLSSLTPRRVTRHVMVDKSDPEQGPMIDQMSRGQISEAAEQLHRYAERNSSSAPAAYNLAVCADAMGDYANALQWYERAISLSGGATAWYSTARDECAARAKAATALGGN